MVARPTPMSNSPESVSSSTGTGGAAAAAPKEKGPRFLLLSSTAAPPRPVLEEEDILTSFFLLSRMRSHRTERPNWACAEGSEEEHSRRSAATAAVSSHCEARSLRHGIVGVDDVVGFIVSMMCVIDRRAIMKKDRDVDAI